MSDDTTWDDENVSGAQLYQQGKYSEAEQAFRAALEAAEKLGPADTRVAVVLNNLASLCHNQRKLAEAQALYERALTIRRDALGQHYPMVAQSLNNLSSLYRELGRHEEAEQFSTQAVAIAEGVFGPDHYRITNCLNNLGAVYAARGRYSDAEQCFQRTLSIRRRFFGDNDPTSGNDVVRVSRTGGCAGADMQKPSRCIVVHCPFVKSNWALSTPVSLGTGKVCCLAASNRTGIRSERHGDEST